MNEKSFLVLRSDDEENLSLVTPALLQRLRLIIDQCVANNDSELAYRNSMLLVLVQSFKMPFVPKTESAVRLFMEYYCGKYLDISYTEAVNGDLITRKFVEGLIVAMRVLGMSNGLVFPDLDHKEN